MQLTITRLEGRRNDLLLRIERKEISDSRLSVANRNRLMGLPGMPRHRLPTAEEERAIAESKMQIDEHLRRLARSVTRRARNTGRLRSAIGTSAPITATWPGSAAKRRGCSVFARIPARTRRIRASRSGGAALLSIEELVFDHLA